MNTWLKVVMGLVGGLITLGGLGWLGLQSQPRDFPPPSEEGKASGTVAIPATLPMPVRRYFQVAFGERVPRVEALVAWGQARARFGLWMPLRFRLYHRPGQAFKREMEVTWFGLPVLHALDSYQNGKGMTGPVNQLESGPKVDQGANLILWAEATFYPSILITDPRLRWEAIDENSARLYFPTAVEAGTTGAGEGELIFSFDPQSGLVSRTWALRYQGASGEKVPWYADIVEWQTIDGMQLPRQVSVTWASEGTPWSTWTFTGIRWNVDITQQLPP
ncbi:MAG: hypothetical protein KF832_16330 [Caldilineaceae bacterium]|nr:hypothetical protein [Caldilineaceae bacterium]